MPSIRGLTQMRFSRRPSKLSEKQRLVALAVNQQLRQTVDAITERQALQAEEGRESSWQAVLQSAQHFIDNYVIIDEPHASGADSQGIVTIPFKLWPAQAEVLASLLVERLVIFLKARQIGLTWLCCAYGLWLCLTRAGRVVLLFSKQEDDAYELVRRFRVMYQRLPEWMRSLRTLETDNTGELGWSNGSRVISRAATKGSGRSFTCSLAILDEFAFMQWGKEVYTALKPTIDGGGQMFIISTANGEGNLFHQLWSDAVALVNNFKAIFLAWRARPDRTAEWRAKVAAEALTSALDKQEYPETPEEAFQNTGGEPYLPNIELWTRLIEQLPPLTPNEPLVVAGDAATGRKDAPSDCFALVGVTMHPDRAKAEAGVVAVRYVQAWQAAPGQQINFEGEEGAPGPLMELLRFKREYNFIQFCYDPTELRYAARKMTEEGIWAAEFSQGKEQLGADRELLDLIFDKKVVHAGDELLTAHLKNADRKVNAEDHRLRMVKRTEKAKIDAAKCLSMAASRCRELFYSG